MEWSGVVLILQIQRNELVAVFDTVNKVTPSLYHTLVHQFPERFFYDRHSYVVQKFIPET